MNNESLGYYQRALADLHDQASDWAFGQPSERRTLMLRAIRLEISVLRQLIEIETDVYKITAPAPSSRGVDRVGTPTASAPAAPDPVASGQDHGSGAAPYGALDYRPVDSGDQND